MNIRPDNSSRIFEWLVQARSEKLLKGGHRRYDLLNYLVSEELAGRGEKLKAYAIALDVLERGEDFDPTTDSIVRVEVARLRDALELYYARSDASDEPIITIPKGSYRPTIRFSDTATRAEVVPDTPRGLWLIMTAAVVGFIMFIGWTFFETRDDTPPSNGIPILLSTPSVDHLRPATADTVTSLSSELRQALSKRATLIVLTDTPQNSPIDHDYKLVLRAVGFPEADRISVELIDAQTSAIAWADAYTLSAGRPVDTIDALVSRVSDDLFPQIISRSKNTLDRKPLENLNPWELYLLSTWVPGAALSTLEWEIQRRDLALRAVELDPQLGQAHSVVADKLAYLSSVDANFHGADTIDDAHYHATQALQFGSRDANTLFNLSIHHWHLGENDVAIQMLERVLSIDPNNGFAAFLETVFPYTCATASNDVLKMAQDFDAQLGSDNPIRWVTLTWLGVLHLNRGELEAALKAEEEAHAIFHTPDTVMRHAVILHALGRTEAAFELLQDEQNNWPNLAPQHFADVTMPRRCQYATDPSALLARYSDLSTAYQKTIAE